MPFVIFIVIAVVLIIVFAVVTKKQNDKINAFGIEAEAVVSRIDIEENTDEEGIPTSTTETYYVRYMTQDGKEIEAMLSKPPKGLMEGSTLVIKYLPDKPKRVLPLN